MTGPGSRWRGAGFRRVDGRPYTRAAPLSLRPRGPASRRRSTGEGSSNGVTTGSPHVHEQRNSAFFFITGPSGAGKSTLRRFSPHASLEGSTSRVTTSGGASCPGGKRWRHSRPQTRSPNSASGIGWQRRAPTATSKRASRLSSRIWPLDPCFRTPVAVVRSRPFHLLVLMPSVETVVRRDASRSASGYETWSPTRLYDAFAKDTPRVGTWLDTSHQTPSETVEDLVSRVSVSSKT